LRCTSKPAWSYKAGPADSLMTSSKSSLSLDKLSESRALTIMASRAWVGPFFLVLEQRARYLRTSCFIVRRLLVLAEYSNLLRSWSLQGFGSSFDPSSLFFI
jgi:hypothetical protein